MESIGQNVGDITATDRQVFENFLGHKLQDNQRVVIQVTDADASKTDDGDFQTVSPTPEKNRPSGTSLEDWAIFRDLSEEEVAELESVILERSSSRDIDI